MGKEKKVIMEKKRRKIEKGKVEIENGKGKLQNEEMEWEKLQNEERTFFFFFLSFFSFFFFFSFLFFFTFQHHQKFCGSTKMGFFLPEKSILRRENDFASSEKYSSYASAHSIMNCHISGQQMCVAVKMWC